ncbi:MAG: methylenetetrahydrofolate reductase [NAD(P)H] [Rhodospirillaceae bacterium]
MPPAIHSEAHVNTPYGRRSAAYLAIAQPLPDDVDVSFEFFPPQSDGSENTLWQSIQRLAPLKPKYVSVTYGAGGSTRERTHNTVKRLLTETALTPAAHLTCVDATAEEVDLVARDYWDIGVRHIVALRGDPQAGDATYTPHPGGYAFAADLVAGLRQIGDFHISVGAYPEVHPEARSAKSDLDNLKRKFDAGADQAISQFFFDTDVYLRFVDQARAAGIWAPIIPGIMPIHNFWKVANFCKRCGANVPRWLRDLFDGLENDPETHKLVAAGLVAEQCRALYEQGEKQFHFYTLNQADLTYAICHMLGVRARPGGGIGQASTAG